jgi:calcium-translocating P-type ATPase
MERISDVPYLVKTLLGAFTLGISVVVMAVPEGLPMMIAVVLSSNIKRMTKDNVLVRKPVGIEAAGSMNILFTDKTGTLTEGRLSVKELIFADSGEGIKASRLAQYSRTCAELCSLQAVYNTTATLVPSRGGRKSALGGNSTERAMLESLGAGAPVEFEVSWRLPFDSASKFSAVRLVKKKGVTLIKGAPEKLMGYIRNAYTRTGVAEFDRYAFEKRISHCMSQGRRVILLAESDEGDMEKIKLGQLGTLTLVCAVVLSDRPREDARRSVEALHSAGIQVVMITGDSRDTATAIAGELSLLREGGLVLESSQLAQLSDGELEKILPRLCVVARALPSDKSRLVKISERMGLVVGMTGDGINDAPALRHADVGFAMGSGTQVAKDASDVIILDNALSSIVKAVLYGRNIFKSIRKFICLQLMMNFCAVGISMIGPFIGIDAPVTVVQMLWINIIMDTLGGLAFAGEAVSRECMKERPKRRDEPILNGYMINQIVVQGAFTVGLYLVFLCSDRIRGLFRAADDDIYVLTAFFALFIFSSVFNCFNARSDRLWLFSGIGKNKTFIFIMCAVLEIQIMFIYLGGDVLRTAPLTPRELGITMLLALSVFPADFLRKTILRAMKKREGY